VKQDVLQGSNSIKLLPLGPRTTARKSSLVRMGSLEMHNLPRVSRINHKINKQQT